jgi:hypothetical protein
MKTLRLAGLYFALVFGAGFVFGTLRVSLLVPRLGDRVAELIEAPLMLGAIVLSARWLVQRQRVSPRSWLCAGLGAAALVLAADVGVGIGLRGLTLRQVFVDRDPVAGSVYYALIVVFALTPWLVARRAALAS